MSNNPDGKTGKRSVRYIRPGLTQVIYEDRVLDIRTQGESNEDFASKVKARTGKVPAGYKTKQEAYNARRARNKAAKEKAEAKAKTARAKTKAKAKAKTPAKKPAAPKAAPKKSKTAARIASKPKKMNALEEGLASGKYVLE